jgi:Asp-tRNA(Asn)/Glu-tRNA(Gln) amidotransferase A subunit family amidase
MRIEEYAAQDASALAELIRQGEISRSEALEAAESAVAETNSMINAVITPMPREARTFLENLPTGQFSGVPFLLKDLNQLYEGVVTTNGSRLYRDYVADHDSTLVTRYKDAGLVIFGKTNTPEFGLASTTEPVLHGPTRNPWNPEHSTGGSSGGAAAAVAAGYVPMAHATDGGGSIRIPAACCGLFGLKPTRARTPLGPDAMEGWGGLSTAHAVTRSVRDSAGLLDATAGEEPGSPYFAPPKPRSFMDELETCPEGLRIGLCTRAFNGAETDPVAVAAAEAAAHAITELGHDVTPLAPAIDADKLRNAHGVLALSHTSAAIARRAAALGRAVTENDVETVTWGNYLAAQDITGAIYAQAAADIHQFGFEVAKLFDEFDLLLSPTMACQTPRIGDLDMMSADGARYVDLLNRMIGYTSLFNDTGNPACSLPMATSPTGLPMGIQLVAAYGNESLLLRTARQIEAAGLFVPLSTLPH